MIKISVVMITYNHEKYIEKAIDSVLMQEGNFELELLIGNDKSPDRTAEILKKYENDSRVKIFNREKNMGATKNDLDIKLKCMGKYIAILEGDDYWITKDKLSKQLEILESNEDAVLCYSDSYVVDASNNITGKKCVKPNCISNFNSLVVNRVHIPTGTIIYKNIFKNNNIEKIEKLLTSSEIVGDLSTFAMMINEGKFYKLNEFTGAYRYITNSTSYSSKKLLYQENETYKVMKAICDYCELRGINKFLLLKRAEYKLLKEIKKENKNEKEFLNSDELKGIFIYKLIKPFDDLRLSINKKIYSK